MQFYFYINVFVYTFIKIVKDHNDSLLSTFTDEVNDLNVYIFFGRLIALVLMHRVQVGATLVPLVVRMLAELDVSIEHVENFDPSLYKTMNEQVQFDLDSVLTHMIDQLPPHEKDMKRL